jgi:hypothetical protein
MNFFERVTRFILDMVKDASQLASQWVVGVQGIQRGTGEGSVCASLALLIICVAVREMSFRQPPAGAAWRRRFVETKLRQRLIRALAVVDEHGTTGSRLMDDADRLWRRVQSLLKLGLIPNGSDNDALELGCYALQLPMRSARNLPAGKLGRTNLRDRTEQAAELLVGAIGKDVPEEFVDRVTDILLSMPHRNPASEEAKMLADALNLDDFGVIGLINRSIQLGQQGDGVNQVAEGNDKREQYGYWDARLKDGFHFEPVRKLARHRLEQARTAARLLKDELDGDVP